MKTRPLTLLIFLLIIAGFALPGGAQAQQNECGFTELYERDMATDSVFHRSWFNLEKRLREMEQLPGERSDEILTIPVVVHVMHTGQAYGAGANIPDEQVFSAIAALNQDFRKLPGSNGDGIGVDCGIEFCLATRDPEGNSTTGIQRVNGSSVPSYLEEGIQATGPLGANEIELKSLSVWPRQDYLNVWVVTQIEGNNAQGGVQGYSRFPINSIVDGIVVLFNAIGTEGNIKGSTALNRTVTHEVGHYLGLYHTFHLTNSCGPETNCNTQGDRVCDTPPTVLSANCNSPACSGTQMVENYMDYTAQFCMNAFTDGQRTRMRNTFLSQRASLLESLGCMPVTEIDAGIAEIIAPTGSSCDNQATPVVRLTNYGSVALTSCTIHTSLNNTQFFEFAWSGNLQPGASTNVTLAPINSSLGENTLIAWTSNPNGQNDENDANDEAQGVFSVANGAVATLNIVVDFFGIETTWEVKQNGQIVAHGGPYINNAQGTLFSESICLAEGCYDLFMYDTFGDGMSFTNGTYTLLNPEGVVLASGGGNFGSEVMHPFCMDAPEVIEEEPEEEEEEEPVIDPPVAAFTAPTTSSCGPLSVQFVNQSTNATSYSWSFPGGSPGSSTAISPQVNYNVPGTYQVTLTATGAGGSHNVTQTGFITINALPTVTLNASDPACFAESNGSLSANVSGNAPFTFAWSNGATEANLSGLSAGSYQLVVTDNNGCTANAAQTLSNPQPLSVALFKSDISCHGANDGAISTTATGGQPPYIYDWSSGQTIANLNGLSPGVYSVTVTDANGCAESGTVQIAEPSQINTTIESTVAETCDGNNGSAVVNAMGGTTPLTYNWSNGNTGQSLSNAASGIYTVIVTDANGCTANIQLEIPYDCDDAPESTRLTEEFCGASGLHLHDEIYCDPVPGATMHHWRFSNALTGFNAEGYTTGNNTSFLLENTGHHLAYGTFMSVNLRVMDQDEVWSPWGETCMITMADDIPLTGLLEAYCFTGLIMPNSTIAASAVTGATTYEWKFTDGALDIILESYLPQLSLPSGYPLTEGEVYELQVRTQVAGQWSDWGDTCTLQFGEVVSVAEFGSDQPGLNVWPNPSTGEKIMLAYRNLSSGSDVIEFEVYDGSGKLVENKRLSHYASQGELTIHFDRRLQPGMYFLRTRMSGRIFEEKLIIQ